MASLYWETPVPALHVKVVDAPVKVLPPTGEVIPAPVFKAV